MQREGLIALVLPSGLRRITGGNVYDRVVLEALQERGWDVTVVEPGRIPSSPRLVIVDSLALHHGPPRTTAPVVALVHQLPGEANGRTEWMEAERSTLQSCDLVVAVSEWLGQRMATLTRTTIRVIPPGRDRSSAGEASALEDGLVLSVANGEPGKGVPEAIEAVRAIGRTGSTLVIVGDLEVDPHEARRIQHSRPVADVRVRTEGVLSPHDLAMWYSRARVFLTASRYEGWPVAVAEAMASGIPVAGFDIPGLRELVRPGSDGLLVAPGDLAALGRAVGALLTDRTLAEALGASARERASGWPTWKECGQRVADCVEAVIRGAEGEAERTPASAQGYDVKGGAAGGPA